LFCHSEPAAKAAGFVILLHAGILAVTEELVRPAQFPDRPLTLEATVRIALASDHAGFKLKEFLKGFLGGLGHHVDDLGADGTTSVDYPDFAKAACRGVLDGTDERAILVCGSGVGMSMAANRFKGIRAVLCTDLYIARFSRLHNDANVLCLPGRLMGEGLAEEVCKIWLATPFEGGRHARRLEKLDTD
jgi:ribose 5-phosphate isomerase B